jgi:hypothetical protein
MDINEAISRGSRAKEVLDNEEFQAAFEQLEKEIYTQWTESPARDVEGREKLFLMLGLSKKLKQIIQTTLETGKLAELNLQRSLKDKVLNYFE